MNPLLKSYAKLSKRISTINIKEGGELIKSNLVNGIDKYYHFHKDFIHLSYITTFKKFGQSTLDASIYLTEIGRYAEMLDEKATELLHKASQKHNSNIVELEQQLFDIKLDFVRMFLDKFRKD